MVESISTRRASANARKVQSPSKLTVVIRANTAAHEPVASMRYPEKYTIRTPAQEQKSPITAHYHKDINMHSFLQRNKS